MCRACAKSICTESNQPIYSSIAVSKKKKLTGIRVQLREEKTVCPARNGMILTRLLLRVFPKAAASVPAINREAPIMGNHYQCCHVRYKQSQFSRFKQINETQSPVIAPDWPVHFFRTVAASDVIASFFPTWTLFPCSFSWFMSSCILIFRWFRFRSISNRNKRFTKQEKQTLIFRDRLPR